MALDTQDHEIEGPQQHRFYRLNSAHFATVILTGLYSPAVHVIKVAVSSDLQLKIQVSRSTAGRGARPHAQIFIFLDQRLQCAVVLQIDFRSGVHVL